MHKFFYAEYLDRYLSYTEYLIQEGAMTKEDAAKKIGITADSLKMIRRKPYDYQLNKSQTKLLFKEVDQLHWFMEYEEEERSNIIESYNLLLEKNSENSLSVKEFAMFKNCEGALKRAGLLEKNNRPPQSKLTP